MSYEDAPTTHALATRCLICGRALRDAASVEAGIGPDCRANIGYEFENVSGDRTVANKAIHLAAVAAERGDWEGLKTLCIVLVSEGFPRVAEIVQQRFPAHFVAVLITPYGSDRLRVQTRYNGAANGDLHRAGALWNREDKCRYIANTPEAKSRLWTVLKKHYAGEQGIGPDGKPFTVPTAQG